MKKIKDKIVNLFTKNKPNKFIVSVDPATNNISTFKVENGITEQMKIAAQTIGLDLVAVKSEPMKQEDYDYLIEKHERNNMVFTPIQDPGHPHTLMLDPSHPDYYRSTYEGPKTTKFTIPVKGLDMETIEKMISIYKDNIFSNEDKLAEKLVSLNEPYTYTDTKEYKDSEGTINTLHDISNTELADNHDDLISQMKIAKQRNEEVVNEIVAKHDALVDSLKKHKKK